MPDGICRIGIRQPRFFRYPLLFGNEIKRERWVDEDVNHPGVLVDQEVKPPETITTSFISKFYCRFGLFLAQQN